MADIILGSEQDSKTVNYGSLKHYDDKLTIQNDDKYLAKDKLGDGLSLDESGTLSVNAVGITVDSELSDTSENAVQNNVIKAELDKKSKVEASAANGNIKIDGTETVVYTHPAGTNPHGTTKSDIGLGNVPNVATNDQTPTYSETTTFATLSNGEKLSVAFAKIKLAITNLINHIANKSNPHGVTKLQIGLGNVGNYKAVSTSASQGLTDAEKANARTNIGLNNAIISGLQTTTSSADGGSNVYTFTDASGNTSAIIVKNGSKGSTGATGATGAKGDKGDKGDTGATPTIKAAAGANIGSVGTPTVTASTSGTTTIFTFNNLKGAKGDKGDNATTTATVTQSANGLMSASDKKKLDGIAAGAQVNTIIGVKGNAESSYRTGNVNITAANVGAVPVTGCAMGGALVAQANTAYTTPQVRNITMSTAAPSGGSNGQIHFQYS